MTDGKPSTGVTDPNSLIKRIDALPNLKNAIIFAYSLGASAEKEIPKKISCMRNGIFESVESSNNLSEKMNSYYATLSAGMNV